MTMTSSSDSSSLELFRMGDDKSPIIVSLNTFQGMRLIDIRRYYIDKVSKELKPTTKGLSLKEEELTPLLGYLLNNVDHLSSLFVSDLSHPEVHVRTTRKEKITLSNMQANSGSACVEYGTWPGASFFTSEQAGSNINITINTRHNFIKKVINSEMNAESCLKTLLEAYVRSKSGIDIDKKLKANELTEFLELGWGGVLQR